MLSSKASISYHYFPVRCFLLTKFIKINPGIYDEFVCLLRIQSDMDKNVSYGCIKVHLTAKDKILSIPVFKVLPISQDKKQGTHELKMHLT